MFILALLPFAHSLGATTGLAAWQRALAGMSAYCAATLVSSPVDVVKCRMQLKHQAGAKPSFGPLVVSMVKNEGPGVFFAGLAPALLMAPAAMVQYTLMDPLRGVMPLIAAATIAGSLDIVIKCPFERVKTALQGDKRLSMMGLFRQTIAMSGVRGLWQGLGATLARDVPYLVLKWLTYVQMQSLLMTAFFLNGNAANLIAGAVAGGVAATAVTPADVIKTRLQVVSKEKGATAMGIGRDLAAEGVSAFFRGIGPRLLRIPIYTAITLATFDFVKDVFLAINVEARG